MGHSVSWRWAWDNLSHRIGPIRASLGTKRVIRIMLAVIRKEDGL